MGYEIIDQNNFVSPTLDKELNKNLSNYEKSIILPLGEVELTKKIKDLLIIFRTNTDVGIWDQNKKRIFEKPKVEYAKRSLISIIRAIEKSPNCNKEKATGNKVANKEPIVGIKFKRKIKNAQNIAKLRLQK